MKTWSETEKAQSTTPVNVCVIDGDQGIRNSICTLLGTLGIRAISFSSAEEFLEKVDIERPQFLILELALPGMSGFELKERLNEKGLRVPCIALTCETDKKKKREADRLGFLDLVEKPFVYWRVVDQIQRTLPSLH